MCKSLSHYDFRVRSLRRNFAPQPPDSFSIFSLRDCPVSHIDQDLVSRLRTDRGGMLPGAAENHIFPLKRLQLIAAGDKFPVRPREQFQTGFHGRNPVLCQDPVQSPRILGTAGVFALRWHTGGDKYFFMRYFSRSNR